MIRRLLISALLLAPASTWAAWPSTGSYTAWSACFKITTQASKLDGVNDWYWLDLDDMPAEFWSAVQTDGDDLRFVRSDQETAINHRLAFIDTGTGTGGVFVSQPHGASGATVDVDSYLFVGNAGASSTSTASTFPSNLECLYMLQEAPTSGTAVIDWTANARHSTSIAGSMTSGDLIAGGPHSGILCMDLDSNDRIIVPSTIFDAGESANAYTWFGWLKPEDEDTNVGAFGSAGSQFHVRHDMGGSIDGIQRNSANSSNFTASDSSLAEYLDDWHFIAVVYNGSTLKVYRDGVERNSVSATSMRSATLGFYIGHDNSTYWRGKSAEIGLFSTALSAGQIAAIYASETDPTFWVIEQIAGDATIPWFQILLSEE